MPIHPFKWKNNRLLILDQRRLPNKTVFIPCRQYQDVAKAIRDMAVRGAPAIGCCAAYGMVLAGSKNRTSSPIRFKKAAGKLISARPTAVNLSWAVNRMLALADKKENQKFLYEQMLREAHRIARLDISNNRRLGLNGARLFKKKSTILTHCNAGALATAGVGTALGVIWALKKQNKLKKVFVDETRPYLQGARLTAWELDQNRIPHDLITDNMAAYFMRKGEVDAVITGCDRVAANGDAANKIGTYGLAVLAKHHKIPFYIAMPESTFDGGTPTGGEIPIEERSSKEVVEMAGRRIAPKRTHARHPAFDVTPSSLITAIISEAGIFRAPYRASLRRLRESSRKRGLAKSKN